MAEKPIKVELEVTTDTTEAKNSIETVQKSIEDLKIYAEQPVKITVAPDPSGPLSDIFIDAAFDATNIIVGVDDLMNDLIKSSDFNPLKIIQIAEDVKELTETLGRLDDIKSTYDLITQENEEFTASIRATGKESQLLSDYYQDQVKSITDMQGDAAQSARLIGELSINEVERLDEVGTALFAKREQKLKDHEALVARIAASQEGVWSLVEDNIPEEMERTAKNLYALLEEVEKTSGADFSSTKETLLDQAAAIEASKGSLNAYNDAILDNAAQTLLAKSYMDDAKATLSGFGETLDNSSFSYYNLGKAAEIVQGKLTASTHRKNEQH